MWMSFLLEDRAREQNVGAYRRIPHGEVGISRGAISLGWVGCGDNGGGT